MSDSKQITKSKRKVSFTPSQEPIPASVSSQEPPQEDCHSNPLPETPSQAEPASHKGPQDTCQQRTSQSPPPQDPQGNPLSPEYASPACQASGSGTEGLEIPNTNGLPTPARPQGQRARSLCREDRKQAHIRRQLMTDFILGSFDDNSSDEDAAAGLFRQSSRRGSRASLGTLGLEAAQAAGETETSTSVIR